jgi:hypothetical protein
MKKLILSLCDHTGNWANYYESVNYKVVKFDIKSGRDVRLVPFLGREVHGILAAPPCTQFCMVGSQYWRRKDADQAGMLRDALAVVDACLRMIAIYQPTWWALENPAGRLAQYLGPPDWMFDPHDYGGWLAPGEQTMPELPSNDAYTKRTCIWGTAKKPETKPVVPVYVEYHSEYRGRQHRASPIMRARPKRDGVTRQELRSTTPLGFAQAFRAANP